MMERRGIYRKGSAGHARNINSYRIYTETMKHVRKWRWPLTAMFALVIVFGVTPGVGEQFQTALLTADQTEKLAQVDAEEGRKIIINSLKDFMDDCSRFKIPNCAEEGSALMNEVINPENDVLTNVYLVENFVAKYEETVARASCRYDLRAAYLRTQEASEAAEVFLERYGDVVDSADLEKYLQDLNETADNLELFVESCFKG